MLIGSLFEPIRVSLLASSIIWNQSKAARRGTFAQVARRVKLDAKKSPNRKNFKVHIYKVLLQVHPGATISAKAMTMMNSLICHAFEKIATEASKLAKFNKKSGGFSKLKRSSDWQRRQQIRVILKTWLSRDITWDSICCPIGSHWRFGRSCNFWRFKSRHAIHNFKCKHDRCFEIRRIFRWRRRRIIRWLIHHGKLVLTCKNITAYTDKQTSTLTDRRLRSLLIGPFQGHPYSNWFPSIQNIAGWFQILFRKNNVFFSKIFDQKSFRKIRFWIK